MLVFRNLVYIALLIPISSLAQTVPVGFSTEVAASGLPTTIFDVVVAPASFGGFEGDAFVSDPGVFSTNSTDGEILRVDLGSGTHTTFAEVDNDPVFMTFAPGGAFGTSLYVSSNGPILGPGTVYTVDAGQNVASFGSQTPAGPNRFNGGTDIAFSLSGAFGTTLYTGWSADDDGVSTLGSGGGSPATIFHNFGNLNGSVTGLAFGTGAAGFTTDLYVGIANAGAGVESGVYRLDSTGTDFELAASPEIAGRVRGIAFAPGGPFGSDLYAAVEGGTIVQIDSLGNVTEFASGLGDPWGMVFLESGGLLVVERYAGRLLRILPPPFVPSASAAGVALLTVSILAVGSVVLARRIHS